MIQIISGNKGKGKTKYLLDMANTAIKESTGSIVYLDKSSKHMYELNNRIRLINVNEYPITSSEGFIGFICGIISQDHVAPWQIALAPSLRAISTSFLAMPGAGHGSSKQIFIFIDSSRLHAGNNVVIAEIVYNIFNIKL